MKYLRFSSISLSLMVVVALISAAGGAVYLAWNLLWPGVILTLAICAVVLFFFARYTFKNVSSEVDSAPSEDRAWALGLIPMAVLLGIGAIILSRNQIDIAVNSPWPAVPQLFWIALFLATIGGVALLMRAGRGVSAIAIMMLVGAGVSVALFLYRLGYGYDPFIHQAAEQHVMENGFIAPKTPYYAGQYALTVILSRLSTVSVQMIDTYLLPSFAALGIAAAMHAASRALGRGPGVWAIGLLALLPLSPFINTTPFGLACLYALLAAIIGLGAQKDERLKPAVWILAAASLMTHPMAGVPAVVLAALVQFKNIWIRIAVAVGGAVALPVLFATVGNGFSFSFSRWTDIGLPFELPLTRFHALGDAVYALGAAAAVITAIGIFFYRAYLLAVLSAVVSGILIAVSIDFSYLPAEEQSGYAARLFMVAFVMGAPAAALAVAGLLEKAKLNPWRALTAVLLAATFFCGGVYLAYPRVDAYVLSKGWNTSATDIAAVRAVKDDAGDEPYIVLAAQPVSAAALHEFGFFKYYDTAEGQIFAYPVPTGGPLYQYYLKMIYDEPSAEYMRQAMEFAGVKRGYFIVNSYWTRADHIIGRAKQTSESWFGLNDADYIFRYSR